MPAANARLNASPRESLFDSFGGLIAVFYTEDEMAVVVFRTKTEVFSFIDDARSAGIGAGVVSVPKEINIGCGLAASVGDNRVMSAWSIVKKNGYPTFFGIFKIKRGPSGSKITRVV